MGTSELLAKKTVYSIATLGFSIDYWLIDGNRINVIHSKIFVSPFFNGDSNIWFSDDYRKPWRKLTRGESLLDFVGIGGTGYVAMPIRQV